VDYLIITRPLYNLGRLVGVLYARLPWEQLLSTGLAQLTGRDSSYLFAIDYSRELLYPPLLPGGTLKNVLVSNVESDGDIDQLLTSTRQEYNTLMYKLIIYIYTLYYSPGSTQSSEVTKTLLRPSTASGAGFVLRMVPAEYHCRDIGVLYVCLLLADEDRSLATLNEPSVNVEGKQYIL